MCSKRKRLRSSSRSGRTNCFWASGQAATSMSGRTVSATSSLRAGRGNINPITDAGSITARCAVVEQVEPCRQQRLDRPAAARGLGSSAVARQPSSVLDAARPSSTSIETSCSTKSGLPSAVSTMRSEPLRGSATAPSSVLDHAVGVLLAERRDRSSVRSRRSPTPAARAGRAGLRRGRGAAPPRRSRARCSTRSSNVASAQWMSSKRRPAAAGRRRSRSASARPRRARETGKSPSSRPTAVATRVGDARLAVERLDLALGATSGESSSAIPAAWRTISISGQNVIPRPYGRQRPGSDRRASLRRGRRTPRPDATCPLRPGRRSSPARQPLESTAASSSASSAASSASRPTIGSRRLVRALDAPDREQAVGGDPFGLPF